MDRRNFFRTMVGGVTAAAAVRTWPFRVFSFPSTVEVSRAELDATMAVFQRNLDLDAIQAVELEAFRKEIPVLIENGRMFFYGMRNRVPMKFSGGFRSPLIFEDENLSRSSKPFRAAAT
jgi:hypothetical protein